MKTFANDADRIKMFVIGRTGAYLREKIGAGSGNAYGIGYLIVKKGWRLFDSFEFHHDLERRFDNVSVPTVEIIGSLPGQGRHGEAASALHRDQSLTDETMERVANRRDAGPEALREGQHHKRRCRWLVTAQNQQLEFAIDAIGDDGFRRHADCLCR
ncbi:hypothetical protein A8O16_09100 [Sphingobium sp. 20006FA]|nr:hypothetical protein A8O16_09100 [Sphingobium sp. 20006FA]